jgi:hypothetical protein
MVADIAPGTLEILDATPATLRAMLIGVPQACIEEPGGEGWSPRDVVLHLASRQKPAFIGRIRMIVEQDQPLLPDIADDAIPGGEALQGLTLGTLLDDMASVRVEAMTLVRSLTPLQLARTGRHETAGTVSAADIVHHIAYHDLVHIAQINALLRDPIERARGAMRIFT